jgi:hypothetical protein
MVPSALTLNFVFVSLSMILSVMKDYFLSRTKSRKKYIPFIISEVFLNLKKPQGLIRKGLQRC